MKHCSGGTVERSIIENTESQALRPSSGSSPSPPIGSGGSPSPPHGRATVPTAARRLLARRGRGGAEGPRPSLLTCRRLLPRRAGVAGGGRVPSAGSPQPAQPPRLPHAQCTLQPRLLGSLRSRLSAALSPPHEQPVGRRPSRAESTPSSAPAGPFPSAAQRGAEAQNTQRDYFTTVGGSTHFTKHERELPYAFKGPRAMHAGSCSLLTTVPRPPKGLTPPYSAATPPRHP